MPIKTDRKIFSAKARVRQQKIQKTFVTPSRKEGSSPITVPLWLCFQMFLFLVMAGIIPHTEATFPMFCPVKTGCTTLEILPPPVCQIRSTTDERTTEPRSF